MPDTPSTDELKHWKSQYEAACLRFHTELENPLSPECRTARMTRDYAENQYKELLVAAAAELLDSLSTAQAEIERLKGVVNRISEERDRFEAGWRQAEKENASLQSRLEQAEGRLKTVVAGISGINHEWASKALTNGHSWKTIGCDAIDFISALIKAVQPPPPSPSSSPLTPR